MAETRISQKDYILWHLQEGKTITTLECMAEYHFVDLQAIIRDLRKLGHDIRDEWIEKVSKRTGHTTRFKRYYLVQKTGQLDMFDDGKTI